MYGSGTDPSLQSLEERVRAHADEHGDQAIHSLLNGFTQVLVHIDGLGLLLGRSSCAQGEELLNP